MVKIARRRKVDLIEKVDQYIAAIIIGIVALFLTGIVSEIKYMIIGALAFLGGMLLLNKGNKTIVNLRTDIVYIAIAVVVMIGAIIAIINTGNIILLAIVLLLALVIAELYR